LQKEKAAGINVKVPHFLIQQTSTALTNARLSA